MTSLSVQLLANRNRVTPSAPTWKRGSRLSAYELMQADNPQIDTRDLERSITQLPEPRAVFDDTL
jgi:hypothetical protein